MKFDKYKIDEVFILMIIFGLIASIFVPFMLIQVVIALVLGLKKVED